MDEQTHTQEDTTICAEESWKERFLRWCRNTPSRISYVITFRNYYFIEVKQALRNVISEFETLRTVPEISSAKKRVINISPKIHGRKSFIGKIFLFRRHRGHSNAAYNVVLGKGVVEDSRYRVERTIQNLICEANKESNYSKLWPIIHQIELMLIKLYDDNKLIAQISSVRNNLSVLDEKQGRLWESKLNEFEDLNSSVVEKTVETTTERDSGAVTEKTISKEIVKPAAAEKPEAKKPDVNKQKSLSISGKRLELLRALLYTITVAINEARSQDFMANDLKRVLLRRVMWCTLLSGFVAWIFAYSLIRDPLVNYAILLGLLGGFFSRLYSTKDLNFKPPAFSLLAQYSYVQPLIGAIGAVIMYFVLLSPLGTELINDSMYLDAKQTNQYIIEKYTADMKNSSWVNNFLPPFKVNTFISIKDSLVKDTLAKKENDNAKQKPKTTKRIKKDNVSPPKDSIKIDTVKVIANHLVTKYPKPLLLLILAFLAGFSEKFFMGTVNKIVGSKFISSEVEKEKSEEKKKDSSQTKQS